MSGNVDNSVLISGKEAKLAWANGVELEFYSPDLNKWFGLNDEPFLSDVFETRLIRFKPHTITLKGIEIPAPFEPKDGEIFWHIDVRKICSYNYKQDLSDSDEYLQLGAWRTEAEIKQVVAALRKVFEETNHD